MDNFRFELKEKRAMSFLLVGGKYRTKKAAAVLFDRRYISYNVYRFVVAIEIN
jgi:hypothetical protein